MIAWLKGIIYPSGHFETSCIQFNPFFLVSTSISRKLGYKMSFKHNHFRLKYPFWFRLLVITDIPMNLQYILALHSSYTLEFDISAVSYAAFNVLLSLIDLKLLFAMDDFIDSMSSDCSSLITINWSFWDNVRCNLLSSKGKSWLEI